MNCVLNINVQSVMNGQLIIGIPVLENKRVVFDKSANMIGIGPAKPTFSLLRMARSSMTSFMKIFQKKSKKQKIDYDEQEQSQNEGISYEVNRNDEQ